MKSRREQGLTSDLYSDKSNIKNNTNKLDLSEYCHFLYWICLSIVKSRKKVGFDEKAKKKREEEEDPLLILIFGRGIVSWYYLGGIISCGIISWCLRPECVACACLPSFLVLPFDFEAMLLELLCFTFQVNDPKPSPNPNPNPNPKTRRQRPRA